MAPLSKYITPHQRAKLSLKAITLGLHPEKVEALAVSYNQTTVLDLLKKSARPKAKDADRNQEPPFPAVVSHEIKELLSKAILEFSEVRAPRKAFSMIKSDYIEYRIAMSPRWKMKIRERTSYIKCTSHTETTLLEKIKKIRDGYINDLRSAGFKIRQWPQDDVDRLTGEGYTLWKSEVEILN